MPLVALMLDANAYRVSILRIRVFIQKISTLLIQSLSGISESVLDLIRDLKIWREYLFDPNSAKR